jgi:hypothetical protein
MNTRPPWDDPSRIDADAREWELQERARSDVRDAIAGDAVPGDFAAYRRIAQVLRTPPPERLPSNFAFQVAQLAARMPQARRLDTRLEQWLMRGLVTVMGAGGVVVAALYGAAWLRTLESIGTGAGGWAGTVAACLLLTWAMQGWRALAARRR